MKPKTTLFIEPIN